MMDDRPPRASGEALPEAPVLVLPVARTDPSRQRVTIFSEEGWTSQVSFYCPVRDRALSAEECTACRHCRGERGADNIAGCADPMARRSSGEQMLREPRPRSLADRTPLWHVMRPCVICVRADLGLETLMSLFAGFELQAVPVVDESGRPAGVVSRSDLVDHGWISGPAVPARTVADVMTCIGFTLCEDTSLSHAAALMAYEGMQRIPVVSFDGKLVGIVSAMDVVRWLAQHDGYVVPDSRSRDA